MTNTPLAKCSLDIGKVIPYLLLEKAQDVWVEHPFSLLEASLAVLSNKATVQIPLPIPTSQFPCSAPSCSRCQTRWTAFHLDLSQGKIPQHLTTTILTIIIIRDRASLGRPACPASGSGVLELQARNFTLAPSIERFLFLRERFRVAWNLQQLLCFGFPGALIRVWLYSVQTQLHPALQVTIYCDDWSSRCWGDELCRPPPCFRPIYNIFWARIRNYLSKH